MNTQEIQMNRNTVIALVLASAAAAGNAFAGTSVAGDISVETTPFTSSVTRAEVQAQLAEYKKSGVNPWSTSYNPLRAFRSTKTRAEVTAEFQASRDQVAAFTREDSGSAYLSRNRSAGEVQQFAGEPRAAQ
jgi:vacuolar-type H+-ATPase catalytic subunit A/Vma1